MITTPIDVLYNVKNNMLNAPVKTTGYIQTGIQCFFKSEVKTARNIAHSSNTSVLWMGVLYNRKELGYDDDDITDTEIIVQLYEKHKDIEFILRKLEGDFAFVLIDHCITEETAFLFVARDIAGVYPLFITPTRISSLCIYENATINQPAVLQKGCFHKFSMSSKVNSSWVIQMENKPYHIPAIPFKSFFHTLKQIQQYTQEYFQFAVYKRTLCCCLNTRIACIMEEQENDPFLFEWMDAILWGQYEWVKQEELGEYAKDYVFFSISTKPYTTEQQLYGCEIYYPALDQDYSLYLQQLPEQKE